MATYWGVDSEVARRGRELQRRFHEETGERLVLTSGKRSARKQRELIARYERGEPGIYKPARLSAHVYGFALDFTIEGHPYRRGSRLWSTYWRLARSLGFRVVGARDPVHIEAPSWKQAAGLE